MRCYYRELLWLATIISIFASGTAKEFIHAPVTTLYVPPNAENHDELLADIPIKILEVNEDVAISLDPPSEAVAVSPPIVGPGSPIHLLVVDPQKIRSKGSEKLQLKALGLISGQQHEVPIEVKAAAGGSSGAQAVPPFEKENYELVFENNFQEKEMAIVKLESDPPAGAKFTLVGPLSERFTVTNQGQLVYVTANPCTDGCSTPKAFTLLLIGTNSDSQQFATLSFTTRKEGEFQFLDAPYFAILEEETGVFKKAVKARTKGSSGEVIYSLEDNTHLFSIHPKNGILTVQHPEFLTMTSHGSKTNLTVVANDKKTSIRTTVDVTLTPVAAGQNGFKFSKESYSFTVSPGQTTVGEVTVADAGNHSLHYDIAEGAQGVLAIDDTGILSYQGGPEKDSRNFSILVSAQTTKGQFLVATAWVDIAVQGINSYPVKIVGPTHRVGILSASSKRGAKVARIEMTDADEDAAIQLSIESIAGIFLNGSEAEGLNAELFKTTMDGKTADLILAERIFDLPLASVTVQLRAQDHAHSAEPSVLVTQHLTVLRKQPLVVQEPIPFKFIEMPKTIRIPADSTVGSVVYAPTLLQSVISNETEYSFELESSSDAFSINNLTGIIITSGPVDRLVEEQLTITVHELSEEKSAQVNLTVVITPARFQRIAFREKQYKGNVKQTDPIGTPVLNVVAKSDRGEDIKLYDLKGNDAELFSIDSRGAIRLKESIENVAKPQLDFIAIAGEGVGSSTVPVRVTVAKEDKGNISFEKKAYEIKVMENTPLNGYVLHPQLLDNGQGPVEYSIETQNYATIIADLLEIDGNGRVTVKEELQGYVGTYHFRVRATRGEHNAAADVTMHVLPAYRCVPTFVGNENLQFSIEENMPPGTELGIVSAGELNPKCEMKFLLWDPLAHKYTNETKIASIDSGSGKIQTQISFDYEKQAMYPQKAPVCCHPKFAYGTGQSPDIRLSTQNCVITLQSINFTFKRQLGQLLSNYNRLILGLQAGAHQFAQMPSTIRVIDVDDHPLEAVLNALTVEVPEDAPVGTTIATMHAIDLDKSQKIHYRLREQSREFAVNSSTGEVVLVSELDRETKDSYRMEIGATNQEDARTDEITVWMTLKVVVTDVNDNGPLFEQSRYNVLVSKNALPGEEILTVQAFDPDQSTPGDGMKTVYYKIKEMLFDYHGMSRNVEHMFSVGQNTGMVRLEQTVKDFVGGVFHLLLESMDSLEATAHKDQCIVKVYVHDDSDIVRMELPMPPSAVTFDKISNMKGTISNATGLKAMVKDLQYHHEEGNLIYDVTDLRLVLVNRTTSEIIPAERAIAIADKHRSAMGDRIPTMTKAQVTSSPITYQSIPPLAYVLCTFALLLTLIFMVFAFMMCHYRNRFHREKKLREDDATIKSALNRPPLRPINISPMIPTRMYGSHFPAIEDNYAVQEKRMVVAGDDDRRRHHW